MISFIDIIWMEIRLTFINENAIEFLMNGTMQTNIRKNTSFNFKLYRIELSFVRWENWATELLVQEQTK